MIMKKIIYGITFSLALLLIGSCSKEKIIVPNNGEVPLLLSFPMSSRGVGDDDSEFMMKKLRVIIFKVSGIAEIGPPVLNECFFPDPGSETDFWEITAMVPVGRLNIYLIANETADLDYPANPVSLDDITSSSELKTIYLNYTIAGGYDHLNPFFLAYSEYKGANVDAAGVLTHPDAKDWGGKVCLEVFRTLAKITVHIECDYSLLQGYVPDAIIELTSAQIINMPYFPWLTPNQAYIGSDKYLDYFDSDTKELITDGLIELQNSTDHAYDGFKTVDDGFTFYMPEHIPGNRNFYTYLELTGTATGIDNITDLTYRIPLGNGLGLPRGSGPETYTVSYLLDNYATVPTSILTVSRNTWYILSLNIKSLGSREALEVIVKAKNWRPTIIIDNDFE